MQTVPEQTAKTQGKTKHVQVVRYSKNAKPAKSKKNKNKRPQILRSKSLRTPIQIVQEPTVKMQGKTKHVKDVRYSKNAKPVKISRKKNKNKRKILLQRGSQFPKKLIRIVLGWKVNKLVRRMLVKAAPSRRNAKAAN